MNKIKRFIAIVFACVVGMFVLLRVGVGLWTEIDHISVEQRLEITENIATVSDLFILRNATIPADSRVGVHQYTIEDLQSRREEPHLAKKTGTKKRWTLLFPLVSKDDPSTTPQVLAWLAKTAYYADDIEDLKQQVSQTSFWSLDEIVETAQSRSQDKRLRFDFVSNRSLRRTIRTLSQSKSEHTNWKKSASSARLARSRLCKDVSQDEKSCPLYAPILYHGRSYKTFLGLGFFCWISIGMTLLFAIVMVIRTRNNR